MLGSRNKLLENTVCLSGGLDEAAESSKANASTEKGGPTTAELGMPIRARVVVPNICFLTKLAIFLDIFRYIVFNYILK